MAEADEHACLLFDHPEQKHKYKHSVAEEEDSCKWDKNTPKVK